MADFKRIHMIRKKVISDASDDDKEVVDRIQEIDAALGNGILKMEMGNEVWGEMVLFSVMDVAKNWSMNKIKRDSKRHSKLTFQVHEHVKETMEKMKKEIDVSDVEMGDDLPVEQPEVSTADIDDEDMDDIATDASGFQRKEQFEKEEKETTEANANASSEPPKSTVQTDDAATSSSHGAQRGGAEEEEEEGDPVLTLHVEQLSVVF
eukprot:s114_g25.t1